MFFSELIFMTRPIKVEFGICTIKILHMFQVLEDAQGFLDRAEMPILRNSKLLSSDDVAAFLTSYTNPSADQKRKADLLEEMKAKLKLRKLN